MPAVVYLSWDVSPSTTQHLLPLIKKSEAMNSASVFVRLTAKLHMADCLTTLAHKNISFQ